MDHKQLLSRIINYMKFDVAYENDFENPNPPPFYQSSDLEYCFDKPPVLPLTQRYISFIHSFASGIILVLYFYVCFLLRDFSYFLHYNIFKLFL